MYPYYTRWSHEATGLESVAVRFVAPLLVEPNSCLFSSESLAWRLLLTPSAI